MNGNQERRYALRRMVKTYYDFQKTLILTNNRYGFKKSGATMARETVMMEDDRLIHEALAEGLGSQMAAVEKKIKETLAEFPVYTEFLAGVKGVGWTMAAVICSEYDIHEATNVGRMWQYTGLNPGQVRGKKVMTPAQAKKSGLEVVKTFEDKDGKEAAIVLTDEMIRGDRWTPGFVAPFNGWLRTKMVGVLGSGFLKAKSYYAVAFYYPYKTRLENVSRPPTGEDKPWRDQPKARRHNAAVRYMVKVFIADLYDAWRRLEGLPVRAPYSEEKLGRVHEPV